MDNTLSVDKDSTIIDLNFKMLNNWKDKLNNLVETLDNNDTLDNKDKIETFRLTVQILLTIDFNKLFCEINYLKK